MVARRHSLLMALVCLSVLAGCGFTLRGSDALPSALKITYVQANQRSTPLLREFDRQLQIAGGVRTPRVSEATATLRILTDDSGERVLSLATTGGPEELEAFHVLEFELWQNGERIYGPDTITLRRDYTFNKNDVLGKRREFQTLQLSLRQNIVAMMIRRLAIAPSVK
ncbi:MAG: LPS assembly lipoprotein LptE [Pseudomonadota bacterium]